ncbi:MAG: Yip1 family protein [Bacteroidota bacterium]
MTETLDQFEREEASLDEDRLLLYIWFRPRATFAYILKNCPDKYVQGFLVLAGVISALNRAVSNSSGDNLSFGVLLITTLFLGGLFGWLGYYIYAWALSASGKFIGGKADGEEFRMVLAWSSVPLITTLVFFAAALIVLQEKLFIEEPSLETNLEIFVYFSLGVANIVFGIWSFVLLVIGTSEIQQFGIGKAILNVIMPALIILLPLFLLFLIFLS